MTVVSPLQSQLVRKAAEEPGSAATKRFKEKQNKYLQPCKNEGIEFLPVVVETLGGFHPDSALVVKKLARQVASQSGQPVEETTRHLFQRLSIQLAKGNSALIITRNPTFVEGPIDGDRDI